MNPISAGDVDFDQQQILPVEALGGAALPGQVSNQNWIHFESYIADVNCNLQFCKLRDGAELIITWFWLVVRADTLKTQ